MTGKIDENIDLVFLNARGDLLRRSAAQIAPCRRMWTQRCRRLVRLRCQTVSVYIKMRAIVHRQHRLDKMQHHIAAKIRRNIPNADLLVPIGLPFRTVRNILKNFLIRAVGAEQFIHIRLLRILCEEERTVQRRIRRLFLIRAAIKLRRPHITHTIGDGSPQPHKRMPQRRAPRCKIRFCERHCPRQISLPLYGIGMEIAQHIVLHAGSKRRFCALLRLCALPRLERRKDARSYLLDVSTDSIVTDGRRL